MRAKMSKITDLISKLETFSQGDDASRVKKYLTQNSKFVLFSVYFKQFTDSSICVCILYELSVFRIDISIIINYEFDLCIAYGDTNPVDLPSLSSLWLRSIQALESKMAAAESAYDAFAASKSELGEAERTHESPVCNHFQRE